MPSPIAHIATGAFIARLTQSKVVGRKEVWRWWLVCMAVSMAPDVDAVIGVLRGDLGAWHNQGTHSLFAGALVCAILLPMVSRFLPGLGWVRLYGWLGLLYGMHLLMDAFTYGRGIKLFWPISDMRFRSPVLLFYGFRWSDGLFSARHLITLASETAFVVILFVAGALISTRPRQQ